jgi:probable F420-dependent oxidoreductase
MQKEAEHPGRAVARKLGRVGVWTFEADRMSATEERGFAQEIERLGYPTLWIPESVVSKEVFAHLALLLGASERLVLASGIANIHAHDPYAMANGARALAEAYPGRLVLGIGVSHAPAVKKRGGTYDKPLQQMREYLDLMDVAAYAGPEPVEPAPRVLAALGPKMLQLAAQRSAGAHPYFVPVEHTSMARGVLGAGPLLATEQAVVLETDPVEARRVARLHMQRYLRLDNYANNLRRLGWGEDDLAGDAGHAGNAGNAGDASDALVDAIVAWGDEAGVAGRVRAHLDAGADHVCIQALPGGRLDATEQLRALAPSLLAL